MSDSSKITRDDFVPSLLPPPLRGDLSRRALETVHAQRVNDIDVAAIVSIDYEHVSASVLPALAEQSGLLGDAGWDYAGYGPSPEAKQRQLLRQAVPLQAKRGTRGAVEEALAALNVSSHISEWWEQSPQGAPYTFRVDLLLSEMADNGQPVLTAERVALLVKTVKYWKNVRSGFSVRMGVQYANTLRVANAHQQYQVARWTCDAKPVQPNPFTNTLRVTNAYERQQIARYACEAQAVRPNPFMGALRLVSAIGRGVQVIRLSMECSV